jgi:hypothetical protein
MPFLPYQDPGVRLRYPKQDADLETSPSTLSISSLPPRACRVEGRVSAQVITPITQMSTGFPCPAGGAGQTHRARTGKRDARTPCGDLRSHVPGRTTRGGSARNHMRGPQVRAWAARRRCLLHVPHRRPRAAVHRRADAQAQVARGSQAPFHPRSQLRHWRAHALPLCFTLQFGGEDLSPYDELECSEPLPAAQI